MQHGATWRNMAQHDATWQQVMYAPQVEWKHMAKRTDRANILPICATSAMCISIISAKKTADWTISSTGLSNSLIVGRHQPTAAMKPIFCPLYNCTLVSDCKQQGYANMTKALSLMQFLDRSRCRMKGYLAVKSKWQEVQWTWMRIVNRYCNYTISLLLWHFPIQIGKSSFGAIWGPEYQVNDHVTIRHHTSPLHICSFV